MGYEWGMGTAGHTCHLCCRLPNLQLSLKDQMWMLNCPYDTIPPWWLRWQRICLQCWRPRFHPWVGKIPWWREWLPTLVFLPGESPWTEELGGLQSMGLQRVRHNWATNIFHFSSFFLPVACWALLSIGVLQARILNAGCLINAEVNVVDNMISVWVSLYIIQSWNIVHKRVDRQILGCILRIQRAKSLIFVSLFRKGHSEDVRLELGG